MAGTGNGPYRVFVSHNRLDKHLARAVTRVIRDAFGDRVEPYLAVEEVPGGVAWKEELQRRLKECDAIVSVMTRESVDKPWLYIEWSPFWLGGKQFYVLVSEEEMKTELVAPMQDTQVTDMRDPLSVTGFFRALHGDAGLGDARPVPVDHVPAFVEAVAEGMRDDVAESFDRYADPAAKLPVDSRERWKILEYFYHKERLDAFRTIARRAQTDAFQADVAIWVVAKDDLETARLLCGDIQSAEHLYRVAWKMVEEGHEDAPELRHVVDVIRRKNEAELRKLAIQLLGRGREKLELFRYIVGIMANMAEVRKIAVHFVENGWMEDPVLAEVIEKFRETNRAELRKVALEFIGHEVQRSPLFDTIMEILVTRSAPHALPVLEELRRKDSELLAPLYPRLLPLVTGDNAAMEWLKNAVEEEAPA